MQMGRSLGAASRTSVVPQRSNMCDRRRCCGAEAEDGNLEAGAAELTMFHG